MSSRLEEIVGRGLARWSVRTADHAVPVLVTACLLTVLSLQFVSTHLGVNADTGDLFDPELPFRRMDREIDESLPARTENMTVVLDGPTEVVVDDAVRDLLARLRREDDLFLGAFAPGAGPFFDRNGLLYLDADELDRLSETLVSAQPFLAELVHDPSLRGLFGQLSRAVDPAGAGATLSLDRTRLLRKLDAAVKEAVASGSRPLGLGDMLFGSDEGSARRFVMIRPGVDYAEFTRGRKALERVHRVFDELSFPERGVRARVTGELVLEIEELSRVRGQALVACVVSLALVSLILWYGIRWPGLILGTLAALGMGLVWTAAFAAWAVGHLNLISVAFAVLFIGLGVDFGTHFSLRYRELLAAGESRPDALADTGRGVGSSLLLCALTTAIGFYSFLPTGFRGVAELGLISGTGMLISLLASLTVLPAVIGLGRGTSPPGRLAAGTLRLPRWPMQHPGPLLLGAGVLAAGAAVLVPGLRFDANPLHVRDPGVESVQTLKELIAEGDQSPWSIEILAPDLAEADRLSDRLDALPGVHRTLTLSRFVPEDQGTKLAVLDDLALLLGLEDMDTRDPPTPARERTAVGAFRSVLRRLEAQEGGSALGRAARGLGASLDRFLDRAREDPAVVRRLHVTLLEPLLGRLRRLRRALEAGPVTLDDLPAALRERMLTDDGRALVEVYPPAGLDTDGDLSRFVTQVRSVSPRASGTAVEQLESARTIVASLWEALGMAALPIVLLLLALWRSLRDTLLAMAPLALAALLTAGLCVVIHLPINFADVIVIPLLVGIGIDSGIHLVHRYRDLGPDAEGLMQTSTSRAVLWSALTTVASFGTLAFASHRGMATLGRLLTLGVGMTLLCNLLVLPALLVVLGPRRAAPPGR